MTTIGISGKKHSGKDTVADFIIEIAKNHSQLTPVKLGFADALYKEIAVGLMGEYFYSNTVPFDTKQQKIRHAIKYIKDHKDNFRLILQGWGTDFRRGLCGEDYWIARFKHEVNRLPDDILLVVPDVRFRNELECLGDKAIMIRVVRPFLSADAHQSENDLTDDSDDYGYVIHNDGSLEDLKNKIKIIMSNIRL